MTENKNTTNEQKLPTESQQTPREKDIRITVDNEQTKILAEQLAKAEASKKEMEEKLLKIEADNKIQAEASKKAQEETEDLKNKLGIIAEKELDKKRKGVVEKANVLLKDPERVKEIEAKLSTPDGIAAMEYTMNVLEKQMKVGEEQYKTYQEEERKKAEVAAKAAEESADAKAKADAEAEKSGKPQPKAEIPAGSAPLNSQQMGNPLPPDLMHMKFNSYAAMVRYLHEVEDGPNKERAAEAKVALNDLLRKWASLVKQSHDAMTSTGPENLSKESPSIKEMTLSKRAKEELRRREQGLPAQSVVTGGE